MRLVLWMNLPTGCVWLVSLAIAKSNRQINDWMNERKRKRTTHRLATNLTGKFGNRTQALAVRQVRIWADELKPGDMLVINCDSALPEKQFRVWKKWFEKHEDLNFEVKENFKAFWLYKSP